ncbi:zinc finger protein Aiolos [Pleurodeles waltl]
MSSMNSETSQDLPEPADLSISNSKGVIKQEAEGHIKLTNGEIEEYSHAAAQKEQKEQKEIGAISNNVKDEYQAEEADSLKQDPVENGEDLSYNYGHRDYESTEIERTAGGYESGRVLGGKLSCDVCGLPCISMNVLMVHKRSHTGERPFQCNQCGASFTQKGNLLRHGKLHTGEKPFKCHLCSYACQRRDALSGHLRTHSVEKPFKCEFCCRSYKQRSSLEEHKERCRLYLPSDNIEHHAEEPRHIKAEMGSQRALVLDRLASNVAKRKSSLPQKFTGPKHHCFEVNHTNSFMYNKEYGVMQGHIRDQTISGINYFGLDASRPFVHSPPSPAAEMVPVINSLYPIPLTRNEMPNGTLQDLDKSHNNHLKEKQRLCERGLSPNQSGHDSTDTDSNQDDRPNHGFPPAAYAIPPQAHNGLPPQREITGPYALVHPPLLTSMRETFKLTGREGETLGMYRCDHCRVFFLDYVMFTIHMGCHGFRDPFECNMCGYRSQDRYEFSSHIARGEHRAI